MIRPLTDSCRTLELHPPVLSFEEAHDLLKRVLGGARDPQFVRLDLDLDLLESVTLYRLHHLSCGLLVDPLLETHGLAGSPQAADLDPALIQILHGNAPPRELLTHNLEYRRQAIFVIRLQPDFPSAPVELHRAVPCL